MGEAVIRTLAEWGIVGCRHESLRGVWVKCGEDQLEKIASIGVRISRGITMHVFALNVKVDLQPFSLLTPCGIENCKVTSIKKILDQQVDCDIVRERLAAHFADVFRLEWTEQKWEKSNNGTEFSMLFCTTCIRRRPSLDKLELGRLKQFKYSIQSCRNHRANQSRTK